LVNIKDVDRSDLPAGDRLKNIFDRQRELMAKYHHIEKANNLLLSEDVPVDLDDKYGQARLKDFAWRFTEELGEALDALLKHADEPAHGMEEVADALHFLAEFTILAGIPWDGVIPPTGTSDGDGLTKLFSLSGDGDALYLNYEIWKPGEFFGQKGITYYEVISMLVGQVIAPLAMACNCLKNKPWKQTHMPTDYKHFRHYIQVTWWEFIRLAREWGFTEESLYEMYFGKADVNAFRQRSNY